MRGECSTLMVPEVLTRRGRPPVCPTVSWLALVDHEAGHGR